MTFENVVLDILFDTEKSGVYEKPPEAVSKTAPVGIFIGDVRTGVCPVSGSSTDTVNASSTPSVICTLSPFW